MNIKASMWSKADQRLLDELQASKAEWERTSRAPLIEVLNRLYPKIDTPAMEKLLTFHISHADELRDALAPFDSGVRVNEMPAEPAP